MEEKEIHDELAAIRGLMERSSKFISLSGLSGILAGVYALIGAAAAYYCIYYTSADYNIITSQNRSAKGLLYVYADGIFNIQVLIVAVLVLIASVTTGISLSIKKAKRKGQPFWNQTSKSLLFHMCVPLITGGILVILFASNMYYAVISPCCLIFYGLALVSASNFTFTDVKYLGLMEIALGLIAACFPGYGLLFWAIGFGVLHIVYGSMMYLKYDR